MVDVTVFATRPPAERAALAYGKATTITGQKVSDEVFAALSLAGRHRAGAVRDEQRPPMNAEEVGRYTGRRTGLQERAGASLRPSPTHAGSG